MRTRTLKLVGAALVVIALCGAVASPVYLKSLVIGGGPLDADGGLSIDGQGDVTTTGDYSVGSVVIGQSGFDIGVGASVLNAEGLTCTGGNVIAAGGVFDVLTLTTPLAIEYGGTGAVTAGEARTELGLGTLSTQNANAVSISGGAITGITDLAVADGGTGAGSAAGARSNLGLGAAALLGTPIPLASGGTGATSAATARTALGLGTISTQAASSVAITGGAIDGTAIGGTTAAAGTFSALTVKQGALSGLMVGQPDTDCGVLYLFGGSGSGGIFQISNAASHDDTVEVWELKGGSVAGYYGDLVFMADTTKAGSIRAATKVLDWNYGVKATSFTLAALNTAPEHQTSTGTEGEIRVDASYVYVCTATNHWKRTALSDTAW